MSNLNGKKALSGTDSFSDLMSFAGGPNRTKKNANMTMQERQAELLKEKQQKQKETESTNSHWGASLDLLGSGFSTPSLQSTPNTSTPAFPNLSGLSTPSINNTSTQIGSTTEEDPFDIFNKPPTLKTTPAVVAPKPVSSSATTATDSLLEGFTDAFPTRPSQSTNEYPSTARSSTTRSSDSVNRVSTPTREEKFSDLSKSKNGDPRDPFIAELVEMGFSVEQAKRGLSNTDTGLDVRQAIDFLMKEAHSKATGKPVDRSHSRSSRSNNQSPDLSKLAQDFSNQFISKGLSIFNQGKKNLAKAIEQYSGHNSDDGTPAWMREQDKYKHREAREWDEDAQYINVTASVNAPKRAHDLTDEARALESHKRDDYRSRSKEEHPQHRERTPTHAPPQFNDEPFHDDDDDEDDVPRKTAPPAPAPRKVFRPAAPASASPSVPPSAAPMSRAQQFKTMKADDDMPMRRRQPPNPKPQPVKEFKSSIPDRPKVPTRPFVSVSKLNLDMYTTSRTSGTEAFKRGDFPEAVTYYTQALQAIPSPHLLRTIVLSNRATCYLKLGDAKAALADTEEGLTIIGPGLGNNEEAELGKSLKEIWSKLATKKAEALESRELFTDSLKTWNLLIENGFSNKISLDGKRRCQQALEPKKPTPPKPAAPAKKSTPNNTHSVAAEKALKKIRAANQDAEKEESEKFALVDIVEEKIGNWRNGKEKNLLGLLSTVDVLLWPELGWKKISLADLVLPKKVKLNYMKAVAKTHPDKVPASATTEQKMIAQAVFVTLNAAWDDYKVANNMN
jgi:tetratricopeptide (TPR) repeat protein